VGFQKGLRFQAAILMVRLQGPGSRVYCFTSEGSSLKLFPLRAAGVAACIAGGLVSARPCRTYIYVYMYTYISESIHTYEYVSIYIYMYIYIYIHR
jgi:hypothetical protein